VRRAGALGYAPQDRLVFGALTVLEHFRSFAAAYGIASWEEPMDRLLDRLGFAGHAGIRAERLSGGTQQKLSLALALLHDPALLLLDEPYAGLDWQSYLRFWDLAAELRARGRGLVVVSNLVLDRERFDTLYELRQGVMR
jgi:ABC-type multidrug transport system ATPase subunit